MPHARWRSLTLAGLVAVTAALLLVARPAPSAPAGPTFNHDIAPVLFAQCAPCHRSGQVAPFPLLSYGDARKRARQLATVTASRYMPPWKAVEGYGEFQAARHLTDSQVALFKAWADAGAPEGDARDLPPAPQFTDGWTLGPPDLVLEPDAPFEVYAEGRDLYRCFVLPTNFGEDRYVSAMEVRPGNRRVVHHVIAYLDTKGRARKLDERDPGPGYTQSGGVGFATSGTLGGWAPGNDPRLLPDGVGILLPKGADVVLQTHYHPTGKVEHDRTKIGLYFSRRPVDKRLRVAPVINFWLRLQPGQKNQEVHAWLPVPADVTVHQIMPHMHMLGRDMKVWATSPDRNTQTPLIRVDDWDFNWQMTYTYRRPVPLAKGSRVDLTAHYDNSAQNPRNPYDPPRLVTWGEATTDEMCIAFVFYTVDSESILGGRPEHGFADTFGA